MKKINPFITVILMLLPLYLHSQVTTQDFESLVMADTTFTNGPCNDGDRDYFDVVCENGAGCGNEIASSISFTGTTGSFLSAHDTNAEVMCGSSSSVSIVLEDLDISNASCLSGDIYICFTIAEDDDGSSQDWDGNSSVLISYNIDNAMQFKNLVAIESATTGFNTEPSLDTDCDGLGDGPAITDTWTEYCFAVLGEGSSMDILIEIENLNDNDEDLALDNFEIWCESSEGNLPTSVTATCTEVCDNCDTAGGTDFTTDPGAFGTLAAAQAIAAGMNDTWETDEEADCPNGENLSLINYGVFSAPVNGVGTISGLTETAGGGCTSADYYYMNATDCPEDFDINNPAAWGSPVSVSSGEGESLQGGPVPDDLDGLVDIAFSSAGSGLGSESAIVVCFTGCTVDNFAIWIGDVEGTTGCPNSNDNNPALFFVWDNTGTLISCQEVPTATTNQSNCTGTTNNNSGFVGCGNTETVWIEATASNIKCFGIQVGDFCGDDGNTEHLSLGGLSIGGSCVTLPVTLVSFTASARENMVDLNWKTDSELNNDYFDIQWSADGRNFENIGSVTGAGTTSSPSHYSHSHRNPVFGLNYYRLAQVDIDGSVHYSVVKSVQMRNGSGVKMYPTVVTDELVVELDEIIDFATLNIYSTNGQLLGHYDIESSQTIDLTVLPSGIYLAQLTYLDQVIVSRIIKN